MKKIALLFTLTLCAGQLYSMEPEHGHYKGLGGLPPEMQIKIIPYLLTNDNLDKTIKDIKATSLVDKELNNIINDMYVFTKLVHMLADKFNNTTNIIAEKFNIPIAKKYVNLGETLIQYLAMHADVEQLIQIINEGADVNYSRIGGSFGYLQVTPLAKAVHMVNVNAVKLLLKSGANPYFEHSKEGTPLNYVQKNLIPLAQERDDAKLLQDANSIKSLLEAAMKK